MALPLEARDVLIPQLGVVKTTPDVLTPPPPIQSPDVLKLYWPVKVIGDGNGIDLDVDLSGIKDWYTKRSKLHEEASFRYVVSDLATHEAAIGPHLLNTAFSRMSEQHISVPDALVFEVGSAMDPSGVPTEGLTLTIKRIIEARTGELNTNMKLAGFGNLTAAIRRNPIFFTDTLRQVLKERGSIDLHLVDTLPDSDIDVHFHTPGAMNEKEKISARSELKHTFRFVDYKNIPLPIMATEPLAA